MLEIEEAKPKSLTRIIAVQPSRDRNAYTKGGTVNKNDTLILRWYDDLKPCDNDYDK